MKRPRLKRGKEILNALAKYGVMSSRSLEEHFDLKKHHKGLARSLGKLQAIGLIVQRPLQYHGGMRFYHLSYAQRKRELLRSYLVDEPILPKRYSTAYLEHDDIVSTTYMSLEKSFFSKILLNERQFVESPFFSRLYLNQNLERRLYPDLTFLVFDPKGDPTKWLSIAIEIELFLKNENKIREKLQTFALKTRFDGVLYFFEELWWERIFNREFQRKIVDRSFRLGSYKNLFLGHGIVHKNTFSPDEFTLFCGDKKYRFLEWIMQLWEAKFHEKYPLEKADPPTFGREAR